MQSNTFNFQEGADIDNQDDDDPFDLSKQPSDSEDKDGTRNTGIFGDLPKRGDEEEK